MSENDIRKALSYLGIVYIENDANTQPNPLIIKAWLEKGRKKSLSEKSHQDIIDRLADFKGLLNKKSLKKAAKDFDEEQSSLIEKEESKKKEAKDKLEKLGLSIDDLKELLR